MSNANLIGEVKTNTNLHLSTQEEVRNNAYPKPLTTRNKSYNPFSAL